MTDYVRVRSGDLAITMTKDWAESVGAEILDLPAVDGTEPLPPIALAQLAELAGESPESTGPEYDDMTVAELKKTLAARNQTRGEHDLVTVDKPGNKPQLIAALEADDVVQAHSLTSTSAHQPATQA